MSPSTETLWAQAKVVGLHDQGRKLWDVYKHLWKPGVLQDAWTLVRKNHGAAGVDRQTIDSIEPRIQEVLAELAKELKSKTFRPKPCRRIFIPKKKGGKRPLGIPTVKDRIVQAAVKLLLEPLYEARFLDCSYGYRPGMRAQDAVKQLALKTHFNRRHVLEVDIKDFFSGIRHGILMVFLGQDIVDPRMLGLIRLFLRAGVMTEGKYQATGTGTPQGGVISPLLANVYLHFGLDVKFRERVTNRDWAMLFRYADDFVICCQKESYAIRSLELVNLWLAELGLSVSPDKTRIVDMTRRSRDSHFDFLGFRIHLRAGKTPGSTWIARQPSQAARKSLHAKLRQELKPQMTYQVAKQRLKDIWGGWANYFRFGNSTNVLQLEFKRLRRHTMLYLAKRHRQGRSPMPWKKMGRINHSILLSGIGYPMVVN